MTSKDLEDRGSSLAVDLSKLMTQLSGRARQITVNRLRQINEWTGTTLFIGYLDDQVVATFTAAIYPVPTRMAMAIEDVVVDEEHRRKGFGDQLIEFGISWGRENDIDHVEMTSNARRSGAINMYLKHGFTIRDTNCFRLQLK